MSAPASNHFNDPNQRPASDPVSGPLQDFSFKNSQYQRPNQSVVYTPLADAQSPIASGEETYENPANVADSGPAVVAHSLRKKRGIFTLAMTVMTLGGLICGFNLPSSKEFIAPGPLSSPHGQILGDMGSDRCATCHQSADANFSQWFTSTLLGTETARDGIEHAHSVSTQSQLCMKCHDKNFASDLALNPHNVSHQQLAAIGDRQSANQPANQSANQMANQMANRAALPDALASSGATEMQLPKMLKSGLGLSHGNQIACNACHREHHGDVSLSQLTDQQCQSCHQQTFHSFETDHPEFTKWPLVRRQSIAFDHSTHLQKHFPANKAEFSCNQCHVADNAGNVQLTAPFEQSCAQCHEQQIADSGDRGWTVFALPMIDMKAVEEHNETVGNWPMAATGDFDGEIPAMMKLLLAGDEKVKPVLTRVGHEFSFGDIDPENKSSVADGVEIIWAIKRLLQELAVGGNDAFVKRLADATDRNVSNEDVNSILAGFDERIFQATAQRWLPNLQDEIEAHAVQANPSKQLSQNVTMRPDAVLGVSTIYPRLAAQELLAENPLAGQSFASRAEVGNDTAEDVDPDGYVGIDGVNGAVPPARQRKSFALGDDSELLVENPLRNQPRSDNDLAGGRTVSDAGEINLPVGDRQTKTIPVEPPLSVKIPDEISIANTFKKISFQPGWYRSDTRFKIGYRPAAHADPIVKAWSDFVAGCKNADTEMATSDLFDALTSVTAVGNCRSCHNVDRLRDTTFAFRWGTSARDTSARPFTKFSHRPHLTLPQLQDCKHCHQVDKTKTIAESFVGFENDVAISNFFPVTKADCASCHQKGVTDSGCMQCHNYHVDAPADK